MRSWETKKIVKMKIYLGNSKAMSKIQEAQIYGEMK